MKLFLTSSVASVAQDLVKHLDLSLGNKLVFIDTAAEPEKDGDISWLIDDRESLVKAGFDVTDYTITNKSIDELKEVLPKFDYIYLSGGHTEYLLAKSYESGFYEYIKELVNSGKTYIGTSAGSIITGPNIPLYLKDNVEYPEMENKPAFGLVNFYVVPHWGSEYFKTEYISERLNSVYKVGLPPFIVLSDVQYVIVEDDSFKVVSC